MPAATQANGFASDDAAMAFGYGYSTAEDHGELCLSLYAGARCRAAQYYGGPLGGLAKSLVDRFLLSFGVRTMGEKYYSAIARLLVKSSQLECPSQFAER